MHSGIRNELYVKLRSYTVCVASHSTVFRSRLIARHQWCDLTSEVKRLCFSDRYMLVRADNFEPGLVLIDAGTKGGISLSLSGNHFQLTSYYLKRAERETNL